MVGNLLTEWPSAVVVVPSSCFLVPFGYNERFFVAGLKPRWQTTIYWLLLTKISRKTPHFVENKGSLPYSQQSAIVWLIQFILSLHTSLRSVLILFCHLIPNVLFLSVLSTKTLTYHMLRPPFFFDLKMQIMFGKEHKIWSSSGCSFLQSPVTMPSYLPQNVLCSVNSVLKSLCKCTHWEENGQPSWQDLRSLAHLWCPHTCIRGWDSRGQGSGARSTAGSRTSQFRWSWRMCRSDTCCLWRSSGSRTIYPGTAEQNFERHSEVWNFHVGRNLRSSSSGLGIFTA